MHLRAMLNWAEVSPAQPPRPLSPGSTSNTSSDLHWILGQVYRPTAIDLDGVELPVTFSVCACRTKIVIKSQLEGIFWFISHIILYNSSGYHVFCISSLFLD